MRAMRLRRRLGTSLRIAVVVVVAAVACGGKPRPAPPPADPWQVVAVPGASASLHAYPDAIERYAPDDRGAYVVRLGGTPDERRALAAAIEAGDDVIGEDGYVVRLDAAAAAALAARAGVVAVTPLQPRDRLGLVVDRATELPEVRIELFADASAAEVDAVAAWIAWRGGRVLWRGRTALRARVPLEARTEASRLSVVRWIE